MREFWPENELLHMRLEDLTQQRQETQIVQEIEDQPKSTPQEMAMDVCSTWCQLLFSPL